MVHVRCEYFLSDVYIQRCSSHHWVLFIPSDLETGLSSTDSSNDFITL